MLIKEQELKKIIRKVLSEAGESKWKNAKDMQPTQQCYNDIFKHESPVPYVYDDGRKMTERTAYKLYGDIIKEPIIQNIIKTKWPIGKMPFPPVSFTDRAKGAGGSFPTIGVGHLIKTESEFKKFEEYTLKSITTDSDGKAIDQKTFNSASSSITMQSYLMPESEIIELFKKDVAIHTQFKNRIIKPITQEMFDALTSIAFNAGWEEKHPVKGYKMPIQYLVDLINKGQYKAAQSKILTTAITSGGEKSEGLVSRRKAESKKFGEGGLNPNIS
jgi:GH24 family phage-related lysozyme (muramidase)